MEYVVMLNQERAKKLTDVLHSRVKDMHAFKEGEATVQINPGYGMCCKCGKLVGDTQKARSSLMGMSEKTVLPMGIHIRQGEPVELMDFFKLPMMWLCFECAEELLGASFLEAIGNLPNEFGAQKIYQFNGRRG